MPSRVPSYRPPGSPQNASESRRRYDNSPKRAADKRFYASARWLKTRLVKLRNNPLCEDCQRKGLVTAAGHVHHELPRDKRPDLAFDQANLVSLCQPCHNAREVR